jgi:hypothetical protein
MYSRHYWVLAAAQTAVYQVCKIELDDQSIDKGPWVDSCNRKMVTVVLTSPDGAQKVGYCSNCQSLVGSRRLDEALYAMPMWKPSHFRKNSDTNATHVVHRGGLT